MAQGPSPSHVGPLPLVVIVGRPNVGKSTLFNRLVGKKLALVDDQPGVTRDRREGDATLLGSDFRILDTAGFETEDPASLPGRMRAQTEAAIADADVALFLVDARAGVTPLDQEIAQILRKGATPVILAANKAEGKAGDAGMLDAYALGLGEPIGLSAEHGLGLADLHEALLPFIEPAVADAADADDDRASDSAATGHDGDDPAAPLQLAIVGRPNAGKSTLINRILGEERLLTGPEAGITRDAIRVPFIWQGPDGPQPMTLIDTAGMRKKARVTDKLERLAVADGLFALGYAEVAVLLLDATKGLEAQDLKIAARVIDEGRALVIAINKWDSAEDGAALYQGIRAALDEGLAQLRGVPLLTLSAFTGKGIDALLKAALDVRTAWSMRISTGQLNRWFERAVEANPPPAPGGKRIKLRYVTQTGTRPPRFVIFGTRVDMLPESYRRYLANGLRRDLGFGAVPVRLMLRGGRNPYDQKA